MPGDMWGEALYITTYLTIQSSNAAVDGKIKKMWSNEKPDHKNLQIFGLDAYIDKKDQLKKLEPRSKNLSLLATLIQITDFETKKKEK